MVESLQNAAGEEADVFLYCKSHLRPGASVPEPEALEPFPVTGEPFRHAERILCKAHRTHANDDHLNMLAPQCSGDGAVSVQQQGASVRCFSKA